MRGADGPEVGKGGERGFSKESYSQRPGKSRQGRNSKTSANYVIRDKPRRSRQGTEGSGLETFQPTPVGGGDK